MSAPRELAVVIGAVDEETRDEACRAALGLTLRGGRVHLVMTEPDAPRSWDAERARGVLALMGHVVGGPDTLGAALGRAHVVEVWGPVAPSPAPPPAPRPGQGATAHLVRPGRRPAGPAPGEPVLHLPPALDGDDADRLLDQLLAADRVVVW